MTEAQMRAEMAREKNQLYNWRGRRLRACRAAHDLMDIIAALGIEDGSELPPDVGAPPPLSDAMKAELGNTAANLLRLILIANDGHVSPRKLPNF